jgi:hypothetical protein
MIGRVVMVGRKKRKGASEDDRLLKKRESDQPKKSESDA